MFTKYNQAMEAHRRELLRYKKWVEKETEEFNKSLYKKEHPDEEYSPMMWMTSSDWDKLQQWDHGLDLCAKILGLSAKENNKILKELKFRGVK